jgi:hypothetical protein
MDISKYQIEKIIEDCVIRIEQSENKNFIILPIGTYIQSKKIGKKIVEITVRICDDK